MRYPPFWTLIATPLSAGGGAQIEHYAIPPVTASGIVVLRRRPGACALRAGRRGVASTWTNVLVLKTWLFYPASMVVTHGPGRAAVAERGPAAGWWRG